MLLSTVRSRSEGSTLAGLLVRKRLAACVNILPGISSIYRWKGSVERARECLLIIKTDARHLKQVESMIRKHHTYEVPEMIGWPILFGHRPYLTWLEASVAH
ncbi:MAG: hypothetical protein A3A73_03180 [Omnitrophica bacterium RIFCSPLOWO2_01_FULL_50_24]|nr:MAG: hypothetical protein A3A73_03180 [Omnitrophica bacterium RIFCSPLOWO2_01_FULL_50_24]